MKLVTFVKRMLSAVLPPAFFLVMTGYFIWNAIHGDHGMQAYQQQLKLEQQAELALQDAHKEQDIWKRRVVGLSENALDKDLLDERSRAMLNMSEKGDIVIPYGDHDHLY
ncbi:septum formation initiator family protein [Acetobacteraceae bacterium ESL0709]|nr:septum formation initiator family protein [Acetobacteraceae bacterium ESL0697]MDF7677912.1 septum formation initiator family protein [Acetobacteraceae bacterium ESL0709]